MPVGHSGELCTLGYSVMHGYWDDAAKTAEAIDAEGWMHTGDLATMDAEGYVNIVGRIKDMVIRGGENIYPREVEEFFVPHAPGARRAGSGRTRSKVRRGVVRLDHRAPGQSLDEEAVRAFCKGRLRTTRSPVTFASWPNSP